MMKVGTENDAFHSTFKRQQRYYSHLYMYKVPSSAWKNSTIFPGPRGEQKE